MKRILTLTTALCTAPCFAEEVTLYNQNGVTFGYEYIKVGTSVDKDCPNITFDEYQITPKVENANNKAIKLNNADGSLRFKNDGCTRGGALESNTISYDLGVFLSHRSYATVTPNTGFGAAHLYFLDANDKYIDSKHNVKVISGNPFPEPTWSFPKWSFIDVPGKNPVDKNATKSPNSKESFEKLIVGKWKFVSSYYIQGKESSQSEADSICFDIYKPNNQANYNVGDCNNGQENGKWTITGNKLTNSYSDFDVRFEILQLDKLTLKIKHTESFDKGDYRIDIYKRVN
ncbi:lipocalin family protein [Acinetobacter baumannii]|uniref:lipocalin family protein n=1 Tax=Acinetobacter baumannii TaxID=470 RepID=UPI0034E19E28